MSLNKFGRFSVPPRQKVGNHVFVPALHRCSKSLLLLIEVTGLPPLLISRKPAVVIATQNLVSATLATALGDVENRKNTTNPHPALSSAILRVSCF